MPVGKGGSLCGGLLDGLVDEFAGGGRGACIVCAGVGDADPCIGGAGLKEVRGGRGGGNCCC